MVDGRDLALLLEALALGADGSLKPGDALFDLADLDGDGVIDAADVDALAQA